MTVATFHTLLIAAFRAFHNIKLFESSHKLVVGNSEVQHLQGIVILFATNFLAHEWQERVLEVDVIFGQILLVDRDIFSAVISKRRSGVMILRHVSARH